LTLIGLDMIDMLPILSIVIPTRNSAKFLVHCVDSLNQQSFRNFEVVFVDCASTDGTLEIAASFLQGRILAQEGEGLAAAWNQGILASRGEYIGFLDSDDWWEPDCLSSHMDGLLASAELDYSIGSVRYFAQSKDKLPNGFKPDLLNGSYPALMPGCFVGKKSLFDRIGLFDESLVITPDIQWFHDLKLTDALFKEMGTTVLNKRVHAQNLSYSLSTTPVYNAEILRVLQRRLKRMPNRD
jgi:glycosyltransferase involved in cell wall biosynthesis